jgi:ADP-ribose pyrophosphatase
MNQLRTLYRPVSLTELELIRDSGLRRFPPRRENQPIFYPVLTREYAQQIAHQWNTKDPEGRPTQVGFVVAFDLPAEFLRRFEERRVGSPLHRELWVPSEQLESLNDNICGDIRIVDVYYGEDYQGPRYFTDVSSIKSRTNGKSEIPRVLAEGRFIRVLSRSGWEWVERTNTSAAVVIAAVTAERQLVLVEQYRIPLGRRVIELPAGLVGDLAESKEEEIVEAARRELLEETGYKAQSIDYLYDGPSSSGLTNEVFTLVLAKNVEKVGPGGGDATEDIRVHVVALDEIDTWLASKRRAGMMISPKIFSALYFVTK